MLTLPRPLDVPFTDTSAEALRLSLDHGRIAPLASRSIEVSTGTEAAPRLTLTLTVIGSSHQAILVERTNDAFIETFACLGENADGPSPSRPQWDHEDVRRGRWAGFTEHRFTATRTKVRGDFPTAAAEVLTISADRARTADDHLSVVFPGQPGALTALSLICAESELIAWQSWHCYPQHQEIVHSSSELRRST
ncbi:Protein of unknown function DUF2617 [Brevibacterium siliguriense]|uniref:DUF2617 domain-containing protein n=1 Tax=Brevibacterium siliguriense TaxID=1136497 RepID=A0A1H1XAG0_9MICO|nr:DUF2617 family protein [Brevibacterium siliguriense]SDT05991.1 Protein of unknown function DUF2617 [Brevibacterium siliguriense]